MHNKIFDLPFYLLLVLSILPYIILDYQVRKDLLSMTITSDCADYYNYLRREYPELGLHACFCICMCEKLPSPKVIIPCSHWCVRMSTLDSMSTCTYMYIYVYITFLHLCVNLYTRFCLNKAVDSWQNI